jgi:hypothetical protein
MYTPARMCYDRSRMMTNPHTWARAWGGTKPTAKRHPPRLEGEAFIRALELTSAYLQGNDTAVLRMVCATNAVVCCEIMDALLALAYTIDEAVREEHTGA